MVRAILPLYAARFSCTGAACEDTCCAGWTIAVDKDTWDRYERLPAGPMRERVHAAVTPAPTKTRSLKIWGTIALDGETGACPLLDGGMCRVHRDLGEEALGDTCATYPRLLRAPAGVVVQGLSLSCPEAARLALLDADAFMLEELEIEPRRVPEPTPAGALGPASLSPDDARAVLFFCIRLVNSAEIVLWMRLAILGIFCDELSSLLARERASDVGALLARFEVGIESGHLVAALRAKAPDHALQVRVAAHVLDLDVAPPGSARQRAHWQAVLAGLGVAMDGSGAPFDDVVGRYRRGLARLPAALAAAPFLLEHVVKNEVLTDGFPFGAANPWQHFQQVISRFGVVRLMLAGRCAGDGLPSVRDLVATVQAFARRYHHTPGFAEKANAALAAIGFGELAQLYGFLRTDSPHDTNAAASTSKG